MNMPLVLLNRRRRGGSFSPYSLFSGAAIGTWFDPSDLTTMYQDAAGTTAVTTPGQPVGLRLDKSKGLALGAELVSNGDFSNGSTGWTVSAQCSIGSGVANIISTDGSFQSVVQNKTLTGGSTYELSFDVVSFTSGNPRFTFTGASVDISFATGTGRRVARFFVPTTVTSGLTFTRLAGVTSYSIDNISVRELAGNHATQSVLASRPTYGIEPAGGRRNLLTFSEQFDNAAWVKNGTTVSANAISAPDGTITADKLIEDTAAGVVHTIRTASTTFGAATAVSVYLKAAGRNWGYVQLSGAGSLAYFNLSAGTVGTTADCTATITPVGDGWYRCTIADVSVVSAFVVFGAATADATNVYTGDGTSGIYIWGAQAEFGSTATAYQRVANAFDVTEAGVQTCHYVQYDGSDDGMITNSIDFTATDKMSVFAGVKKTTGNNNAVVIESSAVWPTNAGSFAVIANDGSIENYGAKANFTTLTSYRAPRTGSTTDVMSLAWDFSATSGELSTQLAMRLNGESQPVTGAGGTAAAFGNYKLNIGRRGNDQVTPTLPFNGRDYGIVIVGKATTADEITATERWLSGKTGFYAPIITGVPTIGVS